MLFDLKEPFALDWLTFLILGIATVLSILHFNKALPLSSFFYLPEIKNLEKRDIGKTDLKKISLDIIFFLIVSILFTQLIVLNNDRVFSHKDWILFLKVLIGIILFLVGQRFVHSLHGYITNSDDFLALYTTNKSLYLQWSSLLLFPFLLLSIYFPYGQIVFIGIAIGLFSLSFIISFFKTIPYISKLSSHFLYHIIFYLCTVEILPLIILYKKLI